MDPTALHSFADELLSSGLLPSLTADSVTRLTWAMSSTTSLTASAPAAATPEVESPVVRAPLGTSIHSPTPFQYFADAPVVAAVDAIAADVGRRTSEFSIEQRATLVWSMATMGQFRQAVLDAAYPVNGDVEAWGKLSTQVP